MIFLSYTLHPKTPSYGNRNAFKIEKQSSITQGGTANDSTITTTVHIGTHLDMPYHFFEDGQTIESYDADFFSFTKILFLEVQTKASIIKDELIDLLQNIEDKSYEILIVKTGACNYRNDQQYWERNYGFHPDIYDVIVKKFPDIRIFGFDTISVSSFQHRDIGKEAHKRFLNPNKPILLLEDMDLTQVDAYTNFSSIIIAPLRIEQCDGLPCTVMATLA
ncbi:MAG TPA: cyclase family protein [Sulfuricurvum sp.]|nr:MAG: cyclase [Campylobacterales bacterium 16-40-21]OZA02299.1 MAG: cyclase [Sulfuricurvum sp. 17-40-25]HQS67291.1 cyclase family protein [Sulfuricurvum sp.]HQT37248.1 cyclase family protein [Sulfuricurvum sp.]